MLSLPMTPPDDTTTGGPVKHLDLQDTENRALLALGILDHRMSVRDRYEGAERASFVAEAVREARMALDGASIETILESRCA